MGPCLQKRVIWLVTSFGKSLPLLVFLNANLSFQMYGVVQLEISALRNLPHLQLSLLTRDLPQLLVPAERR